MIIFNYYKPLISEKENNNVCIYLQRFDRGILWSSSGFYCTV